MANIKKLGGGIILAVLGITFAINVLPVAIDGLDAFALAYTNYAWVATVVTLALVFGMVLYAMQSSGVSF